MLIITLSLGQPFLTDPTPATWKEAMALLHLTTSHYSWSMNVQGVWRESTPLFHERIHTKDGWHQGLCLLPALHIRRSTWRKILLHSGNLEWNKSCELSSGCWGSSHFSVSQINQRAKVFHSPVLRVILHQHDIPLPHFPLRLCTLCCGEKGGIQRCLPVFLCLVWTW